MFEASETNMVDGKVEEEDGAEENENAREHFHSAENINHVSVADLVIY